MLNRIKAKRIRHSRRARRTRANIHGTAKRPRMSVNRSLTHIYVQLIDDDASRTLAAADDTKIKKGTKVEKAAEVGAEIAKKASGLKIKEVIFDRGGNKYHGRVQAVADAARKAGLEF